ncbi:hypothetical protein NIES4074_53880 [Cylindrospermum sp. NIES-4074]|nr:hypothetical protein NIES4074_53880 [Cylindrospermum sp. NIES-4074]
MPNPKGNPDSLKPFTTDRDEPLTEPLSLKITKSMSDDLKSLGDEKNDFVREAIQEKLDKKGK